ncbi:c-type cytochrome [Caminibacter pacificus]
MKKLLAVSLIAVLGFSYPNCGMCHNGSVAVDLKKFSAEEIKKDLYAFKSGKMKHSMMNFVKKMSDTEIEEAAKKYGRDVNNNEKSGY